MGIENASIKEPSSFLMDGILSIQKANDRKINGRVIRGYMSIPKVDAENEIIDRRAYPDAIKEVKQRLANSRPVPIFIEHRRKELSLPVGSLIDAGEDEKGLWFKGKIADGPIGDSVWSLIDQGILYGCSMGGDAIRTHNKYDNTVNKDVRVIDNMVFRELSLTGLPVNDDAVFSIAKSMYCTHGGKCGSHKGNCLCKGQAGNMQKALNNLDKAIESQVIMNFEKATRDLSAKPEDQDLKERVMQSLKELATILGIEESVLAEAAQPEAGAEAEAEAKPEITPAPADVKPEEVKPEVAEVQPEAKPVEVKPAGEEKPVVEAKPEAVAPAPTEEKPNLEKKPEPMAQEVKKEAIKPKPEAKPEVKPEAKKPEAMPEVKTEGKTEGKPQEKKPTQKPQQKEQMPVEKKPGQKPIQKKPTPMESESFEEADKRVGVISGEEVSAEDLNDAYGIDVREAKKNEKSEDFADGETEPYKTVTQDQKRRERAFEQAEHQDMEDGDGEKALEEPNKMVTLESLNQKIEGIEHLLSDKGGEKEKMDLVKCPDCDTVFEKADYPPKFCPKCGADLEMEAEMETEMNTEMVADVESEGEAEEEYTKAEPLAGEETPEEEALEHEQVEAVEPEADEEVYECEHCKSTFGKSLGYEMNFCPECGDIVKSSKMSVAVADNPKGAKTKYEKKPASKKGGDMSVAVATNPDGAQTKYKSGKGAFGKNLDQKTMGIQENTGPSIQAVRKGEGSYINANTKEVDNEDNCTLHDFDNKYTPRVGSVDSAIFSNYQVDRLAKSLEDKIDEKFATIEKSMRRSAGRKSIIPSEEPKKIEKSTEEQLEKDKTRFLAKVFLGKVKV